MKFNNYSNKTFLNIMSATATANPNKYIFSRNNALTSCTFTKIILNKTNHIFNILIPTRNHFHLHNLKANNNRLHRLQKPSGIVTQL